ncbi:MAG: hypothetical protein AAGC47_10940 [Bacteroidota bacterium]
MKTSYPAKILVAWSEAIGGNKKIREWLASNGYPELSVFVFALNNKEDAKKWLMDNGYQHLAATIAAAEGKKDAIEWLKKYEFDILAHAGMSGDGHEASFQWLVRNGHREMAIVAKRIEEVKDRIEQDNNDVHRISTE